MKTFYAAIAATALVGVAPATAQVQEPAPDYKVAPQVQIIERNDRGKATVVKVGDKVYAVCMTENQDNCIQPRAAGLGFGDKPLGHWPD